MTLLSIEVEYMVLTLTIKEATWLKLLLTEIDFLNKNGLYAEIKMTKTTRIKQIKDDATGQEKKVSSSRTLTSIAALKALANLSTSLLLKGDN